MKSPSNHHEIPIFAGKSSSKTATLSRSKRYLRPVTKLVRGFQRTAGIQGQPEDDQDDQVDDQDGKLGNVDITMVKIC